MSRFKVIRPGETLLMTEEWSDDPQWVTGETIAESAWAVGPSGPVLAGEDFDDMLASVLISGASFGKQYTLTNIVTTSGGKVRAKSQQLRCVSGVSAAIAFAFVDVSGAAVSTVYESNIITSEFDDGSPISISAGGEYSINGGSYTSADGTLDRNDTYRVRVTSSDSEGEDVSATLTVAGVSDTFTVSTGIAYSPSMDFSDARNSMYVALLEDI